VSDEMAETGDALLATTCWSFWPQRLPAPLKRFSLPELRIGEEVEEMLFWAHVLATIWLPFMPKSQWLNVPLLMGKQHSPTGTH
jgi:hypothetical protein